MVVDGLIYSLVTRQEWVHIALISCNLLLGQYSELSPVCWLTWQYMVKKYSNPLTVVYVVLLKSQQLMETASLTTRVVEGTNTLSVAAVKLISAVCIPSCQSVSAGWGHERLRAYSDVRLWMIVYKRTSPWFLCTQAKIDSNHLHSSSIVFHSSLCFWS